MEKVSEQRVFEERKLKLLQNLIYRHIFNTLFSSSEHCDGVVMNIKVKNQIMINTKHGSCVGLRQVLLDCFDFEKDIRKKNQKRRKNQQFQLELY